MDDCPYPGATWHGSPNCGPRRDGLTPSLIVLHYTAMTSAQAAIDRLCDPEFEVSAHYVICRSGAVTQLVKEADRAWHAGAGSWRGVGDINSRSIGIEIDNGGDHPFSEPQMHALEVLLPGIMARWAIPASGVIGHSDMAPDRKFDPGARFDWHRLAQQGLAVWPQPHGAPISFNDAANRFGYPAEAQPGDVLNAFRQRFRPWAHGPEDAQDRALATDLAQRYGVDPNASNA